MDLYKKAPLYTQLPDGDARRYSRKMFRQQVSVGMPGQAIIQGYTIDVSTHGLSVLMLRAMKVDDVCAVRFNVMINGTTMRVAGMGKVLNCSCAGEGFRIGMQFKAQESAVQQALINFIAS